MKKITSVVCLALVMLSALSSLQVGAATETAQGESAFVRFDSRSSFGGKLLTGHEIIGVDDGTSLQILDTTNERDGWREFTSGTNKTELCILNDSEIVIEGGRLGGEVVIWDDSLTHVVRNWVVVPSGTTLLVTTNAVVKFCPETGIRIEDGGKLQIVGGPDEDVVFTSAFDNDVGAKVDCGEMMAGELGGIQVQTSAASITDNGYFQLRGLHMAGLPFVSAGDVTVFRSNGKVYVPFAVTGTRNVSFSIDWVTVDGTAKVGEDFTVNKGSLSWTGTSQGTGWLEIPLVTTNDCDTARSFTLRVIAGHGVNVHDTEAVVTIRESKITSPQEMFAVGVVGRYDSRRDLGGRIVHGTEFVGEVDGSRVREWDTTQEADGWQSVTSGTNTTSLYVINDAAIAVEGGRLGGGTIIWSSNLTHVVRNWVVVPSGTTLMITTNTVVKLCPGVGIRVEDGGRLQVIAVDGAHAVLTTADDDTIGSPVDCGDLGTDAPGGIQLQSGAATLTDNNHMQIRGCYVSGLPALAINNVMAVRSNGFAYIPITVSGSRGNPFSVDWVAEDGTAKYGEDYSLASGTVRWGSSSEGTKWLKIPLVTDALTGEVCAFTVRLLRGCGVNISSGQGVVSIRETDPNRISWAKDQKSDFIHYDAVTDRKIFIQDSLAVTYSPMWQDKMETNLLNAVVSLEDVEQKRMAVVQGALGEEGEAIIDLTKVEPGTYTLVHTIADASGTAVEQIMKSVVFGDPQTMVQHGGTLTSNEVWTADKVHIVWRNVVVPVAYTITFEPGAIVKFLTGTGIYVQGSDRVVYADGVIFTHINDDTVGGDTLCDGDSAIPEMNSYTLDGNWSIADDCEMRYMIQPPLKGTISKSMTLRRGGIYQVTDNLTIASGATLTIPAGTILKFAAGRQFTVNSGGILNANGTRAAPVVFTSIKDDEHGGDTNGDGDKTFAQGGDWYGLWVYGKADLNYVTAMYAAPNNERGIVQTSDSGKLVMNNCTIAHAKYDGVWNWGGEIAATNCVIVDVGNGACPYRGTKNEYVNCIFYGLNYYAMYWSSWNGGDVSFKNCIMSGIHCHPIEMTKLCLNCV